MDIDVYPYDSTGKELRPTKRELIAEGAYLFDPPSKEFVVDQALKRAFCYPNLVRLDLVTTGSLLRIECSQYIAK